MTARANALAALIIRRCISEPNRPGLSWEQTWQGPDLGLIKCWEVGRDLALKDTELADRCKNGALPPLGWKGGTARVLKKKDKFGALQYLAKWQGLRGEDLDIQPDIEISVTCSATGMLVTFTPDLAKLSETQDSSEEGGSDG